MFLGRFQPLHKGHVHAIKHLLKKYHLIIAVGSINKSGDKNPFSFQQRRKMIRAAVKGNYRIVGIKDFGNDGKWTREMERKARFDIIITGNSWVRNCFRKYGSKKYEIIKPELLKPRLYDASAIRKKIRKNKSWKHLVPKEIINMISRMQF